MDSVQPGQQLDHYLIERVLAHSGMATIYRGTELRSGRPVAIKVPYMEAESDIAFYERFRREEEIGWELDHPSIAKVYRDKERSRIYIAMEWAEGKPLRLLLSEQHKLPAERAVRITLRICDALAYIHSHGVIHRDLKPENIMIDADDNIKLIDFGIAGVAGARRLTFGKLSHTMGTPDYISPEQVRGKRGDARSDLFALGVMLYEMVTGRPPFEGSNPLAIMNNRLLNDPVPPRKLDWTISPQLQKIISHAMQRNPDKRYASARDFAYDLEHQDEVSLLDHSKKKGAKHRNPVWPQDVLFYAPLALIPLLIFTLMFFVAHHP